ncbi:hypothetical protein MKW94_006285 [Papaver nudicaule]|uniref:FRIGIDA-like protein n=1 Tax=Papaver nudicaule TaxID=74823 RepID=A0AA41VIV1_PAPNU|nr:hypothetical protein [Papaver nudicaule]
MVECRPNSTNPQVAACQKCGVKGYTDLLVYCDVCQISAEHVYCLDTQSKVTQKVVGWSCEQCAPSYCCKQVSLRPSLLVEERNDKQLRDNPSVGDASQKILPNSPMESYENAYAHTITDHVLSYVENPLPKSLLNQQTAMADAEVVKSNSKKFVSKQLGKALVEQEAWQDVSVNNVQYKEIEEYFEGKMRWLKKRFNELEVIEKEFVEKKSEIGVLIANKVATTDVEEQAMLDRVQQQKDTAIAALIGARNESSIHTVKEQPMLDLVQEQKGVCVTCIIESRNKSSIYTAACLNRQQCLRQFCKDMDAEGILNYIMENQKYMDAMLDEIPVALKSAAQPAHLVLDLLKGFYPSPSPATSSQKGSRRDSEDRECIHRSCMMLIESVSQLVLVGDEILDHKTKRQARGVADDWKFRLDSCDRTCRNYSLEVKAFLKLLAVYRITSEFDEEELCKLVLAVSHRSGIPDLCLSLGLAHKIPGVVEALISRGRQIDAVHFIQAFKLDEEFPSAPLLMTYLRDLRMEIQRKNTCSGGDVGIKSDGHKKELAAIKTVIKCIKEYKLEADYPLYRLQRRLTQLEDWKSNNKRVRGDLVTNQERKKARVDDGRRYESYAPPLEHAPLAYSKRSSSLHRSYRMEPSSSYNSRYS